MPMPRMMEISGSSPRLLWEITDGITLLWERVMQIPAAPPHRLPDPWLRAALLGLETNQCPSLSPTPRIHTTLQHAGNVRMAATNNRAARLHLSVVSASGSVPCVVRKCILSHLLPYKTTTTKTEFPRFQVRNPDLHSVAASPLPPRQRPSPRPRPRVF